MHRFRSALPSLWPVSDVLPLFTALIPLFLYFFIFADLLIKNLKGVEWNIFFKNAVSHISPHFEFALNFLHEDSPLTKAEFGECQASRC